MADGAAAKHVVPMISDLRSLISVHKKRRTVAFLYGFMLASVVVTVFFAFSPSPNSASPWLTNVFNIGSSSEDSSGSSSSSYRSQFPSIFSYFFPNGSYPSPAPTPTPTTEVSESNPSRSDFKPENWTPTEAKNNASSAPSVNQSAPSPKNTDQSKVSQSNQTTTTTTSKSLSDSDNKKNSESNQTTTTTTTAKSLSDSDKKKIPQSNQTATPTTNKSLSDSDNKKNSQSNQTANGSTNSGEIKSSPKTPAPAKKKETAPVPEQKTTSNGTSSGASPAPAKKVEDWLESLRKCDFFDGGWVRDDSYGLYYKPGSCSLVDEQFNCVANGRPDKDYQKFKWKPKGCSLPRIDGKKMLEMLRGKRLVFVGDSLNRNMWESLVCILKNSVKDPSKVFEVHGRHSFRADASYSFVFKDYGCTIEFFVSPFLVQEWQEKGMNGKPKETLRLDMMSKSASRYKTADVIVFNTGHWWTHEKTSKGEDYYQVGDRVYKEMKVLDAFRRAISTWGKWVDENVNPTKSLVFFRGYSHSHFSGGQWNSGGGCDSETVPIKNETYLRPYLPKMTVLENVLGQMKSPVTYLNVTRLTDFRKDGHPSIYRRRNAPEEEQKAPLKYQDCSHWCLPGVPDTWNELLYAHILVKFGPKKL